MSETIPDLRGLPRPDAYRELEEQVRLVLDGIDDSVAGMATISALVHGALGFLWTGFYRVVTPGKLMRVGPYQGSLGCLEIAFGRGVCGTAAAEQRTLIVDDVDAFPGHISCDARSKSEIVVPVYGKSDELIAVFDIDSEERAAFNGEDRDGLERIMQWFRRAA
ncbi:MAG TPA: GAF domain-containing protein [Gemmatimonadaceae bacterium]|nr:GAF domain-containing protein [Gemmatimonadaceae bacterium]